MAFFRDASLRKRSRGKAAGSQKTRGSRRKFRPALLETLESRNFLSAAPVAAHLLKDLDTALAAPNPLAVAADGNNVFFAATAPDNQEQLWFSDGTAAGTTLLNTFSNWKHTGGVVQNMTAIGGDLFFTVGVEKPVGIGDRQQLWISDGTAAGTTLLADDFQGEISGLAGAGGKVYFKHTVTLGNNTFDSQLWKTDGTAAGTAMVYDFRTDDYISAGQTPLVDLNGTLYFVVASRFYRHGDELWKSDGTAGGTTQVHTFTPNSGFNITSADVTSAGGKLYLNVAQIAFSSPSEFEAYVSDGTDAGTTKIADGYSGSFTPLGNTVYFVDNGSLWSTHGTAATTASVGAAGQVGDLFVAGGHVFVVNQTSDGYSLSKLNGASLEPVAGGTANNAQADQIAVAGDGTIFLAGAGVNGDYQLWRSDGSAGGTLLVSTFAPLPNVYPDPGLTGLTAAGTNLFFSRQDAAGAGGLWTSDGTTAGTVLLKPLAPPTLSSSPSAPIALGGVDLFIAAHAAQSGFALWKTDGTTAGTVPLLEPTSGSSSTGPVQGSLSSVGGKPLFVATDANGNWQLWTTDGTAGGTQPLTSLPQGISRYLQNNSQLQYLVVGGQAYFTVDDPSSHGTIVWQTDGTLGGTKPVIDASTGKAWNAAPTFTTDVGITPLAINGQELAYVGSKLYSLRDGTATLIGDIGNRVFSNELAVGSELFLVTSDGDGSRTLWASDGTANGTALLATFPTGAQPTSFYNNDVIEAGGKWFFYVYDGSGSGTAALWVTDSTAAGTSSISSLADATDIRDLTSIGGKAVFMVVRPQGQEVWSSDGTETGTIKLAGFSSQLSFFERDSGGYAFIAYNDRLLFQAGTVLWSTDGTAAGTASIKDTGMAFGTAALLGGKLALSNSYFDRGTPQQLWLTDGTAAGTTKLADVALRTEVNDVAFTPANGRWFFIGNDAAHGNQLWITDGSPAGTRQLTGVNGSTLSDPSGLTFLNGSLYFVGTSATGKAVPAISDGTPAGTTVIDPNLDLTRDAADYATFQDRGYFQMIGGNLRRARRYREQNVNSLELGNRLSFAM